VGVTALLLVIPMALAAQDVCVITEKRVPEIKGIVSFVAQTNVVGDASVSLKRKSTGEIVETTKTDKEGAFKFGGRYRGRFMLIVSRPDAVSLYIPIRVVRSGSGMYLRIILGAFIGEVCGGGEVKVVDEDETAKRSFAVSATDGT